MVRNTIIVVKLLDWDRTGVHDPLGKLVFDELFSTSWLTLSGDCLSFLYIPTVLFLSRTNLYSSLLTNTSFCVDEELFVNFFVFQSSLLFYATSLIVTNFQLKLNFNAILCRLFFEILNVTQCLDATINIISKPTYLRCCRIPAGLPWRSLLSLRRVKLTLGWHSNRPRQAWFTWD